AGAGGPENDHLRARAERVEIRLLGRIQRLDWRKNALVLELRAIEADDLSRTKATKRATLLLSEGFLSEVLSQGRLLLSDPEEEKGMSARRRCGRLVLDWSCEALRCRRRGSRRASDGIRGLDTGGLSSDHNRTSRHARSIIRDSRDNFFAAVDACALT